MLPSFDKETKLRRYLAQSDHCEACLNRNAVRMHGKIGIRVPMAQLR